MPLVVANAVFGGTFTSRLMREVRSKRGWSYGASARTVRRPPPPGVVDVDVPGGGGRGAVPQARRSSCMEAWVKDGVTPREVAFIQRYLVRSHAFEVDTAPKRLHQALDVELLGAAGRLLHGVDRPRARGDAGDGDRRGEEPDPPGERCSPSSWARPARCSSR